MKLSKLVSVAMYGFVLCNVWRRDGWSFFTHEKRLGTAVFALILTLTTSAQEPPIPSFVAERRLATSDAEAALQRGDYKAAVDRLQSQVRRHAGGSHEDVQIAQLLCVIACQSRTLGDRSTTSAATSVALTRLALPQSRMSMPDSAAAFSLTGEIHELRGDRTAAIDAYRRAIELNPNLPVAQQRLTHLSAIERQAKAKEEANILLARRARNGKS